MTVVVSAVAHDVKAISCSHLVRDYQGSIMSQVDSTGYWHNDWSYDAWGRPRNPQTHVVYNPSILNSYSSAYRGYCGHEHLPQFGLINMNARLYDPVTSRFLSPDPYVQVPDNTQSFNRYSYCLNNPTKYTDPSGELFLEAWLWGAFKGLVKGRNVWKSGVRQITNDFKINFGLFAIDSNKSIGGQIWELISRFTWQARQTAKGNFIANFNNIFGNVSYVRHKYGTTVIRQDNGTLMGEGAGMTLGSYIIGGSSIEASPYNSLFQHEYGHYEQSRHMGPMYLYVVGIPSFLNATFGEDHNLQSYERDANYRAFKYFNSNINGFYVSLDDYNKGISSSWNFYENPITRKPGEFIDFKDEAQMEKAYKTIPLIYHSFIF